jgi:alkylated DNA repair dioxygenase AlkB
MTQPFDPCQLSLWGPVPVPGGPQLLPTPGADIRYWPDFLSPGEARDLIDQLMADTAWQHGKRLMYGRVVDVPRLQAWYSESGHHLDLPEGLVAPRPWPLRLAVLKARVEAVCAAHFNAVLINRYRDGQDSVAWHSDHEDSFGGHGHPIASLTLGATRRFLLRPRPGQPGERLSLDLPAGSLLLMGDGSQTLWEHCVPKTERPVGERLNLTFRFQS